MESKHTNGKWEIDPTGENKRAVWVGGSRICVVDEFPHQGSEANAKLIAAAPELLKSLMSIIDELEGEVLQSSMNSEILNAQSVINKAL